MYYGDSYPNASTLLCNLRWNSDCIYLWSARALRARHAHSYRYPFADSFWRRHATARNADTATWSDSHADTRMHGYGRKWSHL